MKTVHKRLLMSLLAITTLAMGCGSLPSSEYYDLSPSPLQEVPSSQKVDASVAVRPFTTVQTYSQTRVAYRENPYRLHYDHYRQWSAPPAELAHSAFKQALREAHVFNVVSDSTSGDSSEYDIVGRILEFYELQEGENRYAVLKIEITCTDQQDNVIFTMTPRQKVQAPETDDLTGVAEAMSEALHNICQQFLEEVNNHISPDSSQSDE